MSWLESDHARDLIERAGLGSLSPRALKAVLVMAALVVGVGLWRFWPRAPQPEVAFDATPNPAESSPKEAEAAEDVVVHVAGAVMHPGVYELDAGSRVGDAIDAAGGGLGSAALNSLNLARILADGEQVYVPTVEEAAAGGAPGTPPGVPDATGGGSAEGTVNINTASAAELENLPGVGPATAQKIVEDREANGPFGSPEDLMRVPGIGEKKFESLREFVVCG